MTAWAPATTPGRMIITRSLREMSKLGEKLGGDRETFSGLAGMGDLVVTCTSPHSRNRHVGEQLGKGVPIAEVLAGMKQVAEGVKAASTVMKLAADAGVDMPIAREVDAVVNHGSTPERAYRGLINKAPGSRGARRGLVTQEQGSSGRS